MDTGWNLQDSITHLSQYAKPKSIGRCAQFVRTALEAGGINTSGRPGSAYQYAGYLPKIGFNCIVEIRGKDKQREWTTRNAKPGDIAVMAHGKHGHICMWNGSKWISDFAQNNMWPYSGDGICYIFRYKGEINGSITPFLGQIGSNNKDAGMVNLLSNSNISVNITNHKNYDTKYFQYIAAIKHHLFAMMLEAEGVICSNEKRYNNKFLFEDIFKEYKHPITKTIDGLRVTNEFKTYKIDYTPQINYNNNLSLSEIAGLAAIKDIRLNNMEGLTTLNSLVDDAAQNAGVQLPTTNDFYNIRGVINPSVFGGKAKQWMTVFKSLGLTNNQCYAIISCMIYECNLDHTKYNKLEYNGRGARGTEGWNCGEGTVGFTYWKLKEQLIKKFNKDPRHSLSLPETWEVYSKQGPRIVDLSLEDAALFTVLFYEKLINKTTNADLDTCVSEFYLEKAGRGGSAKKGQTSYEKAYYRSLDYVATHNKQNGNNNAINTFLCTLQSARLLNNA